MSSHNAPCKGCNSWTCTDDRCGALTMRSQADEVDKLVRDMPRSKQGQIYQLLYAQGWRIGNIEWEIDKAWRDEHAKTTN